MLRLTHLSRRRDHWPGDLEDGWVVRFAGDTDEWDALRCEIKSQGWRLARWLPQYLWDDEKQGGWWIDNHLFRTTYAAQFDNLHVGMLDAPNERVQWLYKTRSQQWEGSTLYREPPQQEPLRPKKKSEPRIPAHLRADYKLLEVGGGATAEEVKRAYRVLSKKYHPDAGGSHLAFVALQNAYGRVKQWLELMEIAS